ncbi:hypothetical protein TRVA0_082S00232 [Trichomonascus vanleenenianus]|uniref:uncharacterized protein n=1 Tax=Trichomonascus vanleenenianus TaxID=2268995 RepID=UPI003ECAC6B0
MFRSVALRSARIYRSPAVPAVRVRYLSGTRVVMNKDENPVTQEHLNQVYNSDTFQKMTKSPELMQKFRDIVDYLVENQLITPGQPPSFMQVAKIVSNREARDKLAAFNEAAQEAGVDFKADEFQNILKNMK